MTKKKKKKKKKKEIFYVALKKKLLKKIPNLSFIRVMTLNFIKTTLKCLISWNLLGALINNVLLKSSKIVLDSLYFLEIFRNHPKVFNIFEFIR